VTSVYGRCNDGALAVDVFLRFGNVPISLGEVPSLSIHPSGDDCVDAVHHETSHTTSKMATAIATAKAMPTAVVHSSRMSESHAPADRQGYRKTGGPGEGRRNPHVIEAPAV
jgi:hypothetical protein